MNRTDPQHPSPHPPPDSSIPTLPYARKASGTNIARLRIQAGLSLLVVIMTPVALPIFHLEQFLLLIAFGLYGAALALSTSVWTANTRKDHLTFVLCITTWVAAPVSILAFFFQLMNEIKC